MTTITDVDYALMAGASYISTRDKVNLFPVPKDWVEIESKRSTKPSGGVSEFLCVRRFQKSADGQILFKPRPLPGRV